MIIHDVEKDIKAAFGGDFYSSGMIIFAPK